MDSAQSYNLTNSKINLISDNMIKINNDTNLLENDKSANSFINNVINCKNKKNIVINKNIYTTDNFITKNVNDTKLFDKNNVVNIDNVSGKICLNKTIKNYINDDDSELIRDPDTVIALTEKISQNEHIIKKSLNTTTENIHHMSNSDFIILSNLTLLSKIRPHQKLLVEPIHNKNEKKITKCSKINFEIKIDNSYVPRFTRWYYSQGRSETIVAINDLIDASIEQFLIHKNSNNNIDRNKYYCLLENSKKGLSNLKITYNSDHISVSSIDKMLEKINEFTLNNIV